MAERRDGLGHAETSVTGCRPGAVACLSGIGLDRRSDVARGEV
jgi:hypothetical protein